MENKTSCVKERLNEFRFFTKKNDRRKLFERNRVLHLTGHKPITRSEVPLFDITRVETVQDLLQLLEKLSEEKFNEEQLILWARRIDIVSQLLHLYRTRQPTLMELRPIVLEILTLLCYYSGQLTHDMLDKGLIVYLVSSLSQNTQDGVAIINWVLSIIGNVINDCDECEKLLLSKNLSGLLAMMITRYRPIFLEDPVTMAKLIFIMRSIKNIDLVGDIDPVVEYFIEALSLSTTMTSAVIKVMVKLLPRYSLRNRAECEREIISLIERNLENKKIQGHLLDLERVCLEKCLDLPPNFVLHSIKTNINVKENAAEAQMLLNTVINLVSQEAIQLQLLNSSFLKAVTKRIFKNYQIEYKHLCIQNLSHLAIHIKDIEFLRFFFSKFFGQKLIAHVITALFGKLDSVTQILFLEAVKIFLIFDWTDGHMVDPEVRSSVLRFVHELQSSPNAELYRAAFHFIRDINAILRPKKLFKFNELRISS